jgi:putative AdoMet-dependent methyltransferase
MNSPVWQYDESRNVGTNYESIFEVENYDQRMNKLRDIQAEAESILNLLDLKPEHTLIEIGTGTGEFATIAAKKCKRVIAIDISESMLNYAENKAKARSVDNIHFIRAGFLTFRYPNEAADAVVSQFALHHLPDFWKQVALLRISEMLKPEGNVYIKDIVYSYDPKKK